MRSEALIAGTEGHGRGRGMREGVLVGRGRIQERRIFFSYRKQVLPLFKCCMIVCDQASICCGEWPFFFFVFLFFVHGSAMRQLDDVARLLLLVFVHAHSLGFSTALV